MTGESINFDSIVWSNPCNDDSAGYFRVQVSLW